jgi:carbonic anhydrase
MKAHTREFRDNLTPMLAFETLEEGNKRFINNLKINRNLLQQMNETADSQHPFAVALSCMDSRTSVELIFDQGLGEIMSIRIAGNIVNEDIIGSMEYACLVGGTKLIVVLGHTRCGAIKGACDKLTLGNLTGLLEKIGPAIANVDQKDEYHAQHHLIYPEKVAYANVLVSMEEIIRRSPLINSLYKQGKIGIAGGMYSVENGRVHFIKKMFAEPHSEKAAMAM